MAIPGLDVGLVHKLFGTLDTLKTILTSKLTNIVGQGTAAGNEGSDALQSILDDLLHHQSQAVEQLSKATKVEPPK